MIDREPLRAGRSFGTDARGDRTVSVGGALPAALPTGGRWGAAEAGLLVGMAMVALIVGSAAALWQAIVACPHGVVMVWMDLGWLAKASSLKRKAEEQAHLPRSGRRLAAGPNDRV